jgi:cytochrome c oxidase subunit 3
MTNIRDIILNNNNKEVVSKFNRGIFQLHPYHLVELSPWPIFTAFTLFGLTFNTVCIMHGYIGLPIIIIANIIVLTYCIFLWVRDIISEASYLGNHTLAVRHGLNLGYILFIISEAMFFVGIFWAYGHSALSPAIELGSVWPPVNIQAIGPVELPLLNTLILLASGATITHSHHSLIAGSSKRNGALISLALTLLLAILFTVCQYIEYINSTFTITDGVYGSTFFLGTGFHGFHIIVGIMFLSVALWRMYAYHFTETHHVGFENTILLWHFLDIIWLFLFVFLYWWGS